MRGPVHALGLLLAVSVPCSRLYSQGQGPDREQNGDAYVSDCAKAATEADDCAALEKHLARSMKQASEAPLSSFLDADSLVVYRLTVRSLTGAIPLRVARIRVRRDSTIEVTAKRQYLDDQVGYTTEVHLSGRNSMGLLEALRWTTFQLLATREPAEPAQSVRPGSGTKQFLRDGGSFSLEGARPDSFHIVFRRLPSEYFVPDPGQEFLRRVFQTLNTLGIWSAGQPGK
jgi:hypothetical protein